MASLNSNTDPSERITDDFLAGIFPPRRSDDFFEALYGGAEEGAFDISLVCRSFDGTSGELMLEFRLTERPGKCMICSLTSGLPPVFQRHPVIDLRGMAEKIERRLAPAWKVLDWTLGSTLPLAPKINVIPWKVKLGRRQ